MTFLAIMLRFLIILFLLIYILYRLLWKDNRNRNQRTKGQKSIRNEEMVKDPVCGTYVSLDLAIPAKKEGRTYHFCSKECRNKFLKDPTQDA